MTLKSLTIRLALPLMFFQIGHSWVDLSLIKSGNTWKYNYWLGDSSGHPPMVGTYTLIIMEEESNGDSTYFKIREKDSGQVASDTIRTDTSRSLVIVENEIQNINGGEKYAMVLSIPTKFPGASKYDSLFPATYTGNEVTFYKWINENPRLIYPEGLVSNDNGIFLTSFGIINRRGGWVKPMSRWITKYDLESFNGKEIDPSKIIITGPASIWNKSYAIRKRKLDIEKSFKIFYFKGMQINAIGQRLDYSIRINK